MTCSMNTVYNLLLKILNATLFVNVELTLLFFYCFSSVSLNLIISQKRNINGGLKCVGIIELNFSV